MQSNLFIFDLSSNTQEQRGILEPALVACTFDFRKIVPKLVQLTGRDHIPVTWRDLNIAGFRVSEGHGHDHIGAYDTLVREVDGRKMTLGLFWYSGQIEIDSSLVSRPALAAEVMLAEAAHAVDRFYLTPDMRRKIWQVWHPGEQTEEHDDEHGWAAPFDMWTGEMDQPGVAEVGYFESGLEAFMSAFTRAFTNLPVTGEGPFAHKTSPEMAVKIREIVQPSPPPPSPKPEPTPAPKPKSLWEKLCRWLRLC